MPFASLRVRSHALASVALIAIAAVVAACSKGEPDSRPRANAPLAVQKTDQSAPAAADVNEALKERLARQEAASKMFDPAKPEPKAVERKPEPARPAPAQPAEPPRAQARAEPPRVEAPKAQPAKAEAAKAEPPKSEPVKAEPAPAPRVELAAAKPAAAPVPAPTRLVTRVDPEYPREAIQAKVEQGTVRSRVTLDAAGNVTRVDVVEATPRRVFDRAVIRALSEWKYNEGANGRTVEVEIDFKR